MIKKILLHIIFFTISSGVCTAVHSQSLITQNISPNHFSFALIGDLAYMPTQEASFTNLLNELQKASLAFVVHDGDFGSPLFGSCSDEFWQRRLAQFQASVHPFIYTPGDNDWTDCHTSNGALGYDPLERLEKLRALFFANDNSLGQNKIVLTRQSKTDSLFKKYSENARWIYGGITFITLHVVGSNNNLGRTPEADEEYKDRNAADIAWLSESFSLARANKSRAIMIIQQANIFSGFPPFKMQPDGVPDGFADIRATLEKETIAFKKPVVLVHGDSHYFRVDKPMGARGRFETTPIVENFTRVETFGQPNHHWVEVIVDVDDPQVFTFKQRIVSANIVEH